MTNHPVDPQQARWAYLATLMKTLIDFAVPEHREAAERICVELGKEWDTLLSEWLARMPTTACLPPPAQIQASPLLQAIQADADARVAQLLEAAASTSPATVN